MSDYADSNVFSGWDETDASRWLEQLEHDRADAAHEAGLDRLDWALADEDVPVKRTERRAA